MNIVLLQQEREEKKSEIRITIEQRAAFLPPSLSFLLPKCIQRAIDFSTEDGGLEIAFASSFLQSGNTNAIKLQGCLHCGMC